MRCKCRASIALTHVPVKSRPNDFGGSFSSQAGELAKIIDECLAAWVVRSTFVHLEDGQPCTPDGLTSMFRRHCVAAKVSDFGLRDLRTKGATDEYRTGRPIRELQHLLGHKSVRTTEIYLNPPRDHHEQQ